MNLSELARVRRDSKSLFDTAQNIRHQVWHHSASMRAILLALDDMERLACDIDQRVTLFQREIIDKD